MLIQVSPASASYTEIENWKTWDAPFVKALVARHEERVPTFLHGEDGTKYTFISFI